MGLPSVEGLRLTMRDWVVVATLDRGPDQLMSMQMCRALTELLRNPPVDARLLHLRSSGPAFCLGRDRGGADIDPLREEAETLVALNRALAEGELVTVSEVCGDAAGYGVGLAALTDISVASPGSRFWFPEIEAGLAPTVVLAWLPRLVGRSAAFRLTATGRAVSAGEAVGLGLISVVADSAESLADTVEAEISALLRHSGRAQREIRSFLSDTAAADRAVEQLAVDRLVLAGLRLRQGAR